MKIFNLTAISIFFIIFLNLSFADIPIGEFSSGKLTNWKNKTFLGKTDYLLTQMDSTQVLKAESRAGASGLFKEQRIDLKQTPYLNWRWRVDKPLVDLNEQGKSGDDYSARIYVVISGGWAFWKTKAINYVWAGNSPKGSIWPNAFSGKNVMMIALRSSGAKNQTWYQEKRNILQDLKQQFGFDIRYIDAIALMTDTDNAKGHAVAYYGDIYFSEK